MKVVVVGAGTAGLAAVHRLRQAGVDVVAYDAAEQAGGRIAGAQREGCTLDLGAQFFFRFYETTFALCRELGLAEDIVSFPLRMAMARGGRLYPVTATPDPRLLWRYRRDFLRFRGVPWSGMVQFARILPLLAGITDNAMKSGHYAPPGRGLVHAFSHGRHARRLNALGDADIRSTLLAEVRRILPAMPGQPLFTAVRRWDEAVCLAPPGMLTAMQRLRRHHYRDLPGLFLAGEYLGMPSVEGALRSGLDAAAAVLRG